MGNEVLLYIYKLVTVCPMFAHYRVIEPLSDRVPRGIYTVGYY